MGKISPQFIKYMIKVKFEARGEVEKPDVIGAIFGQTEGLLGEELELRDLQKKGKIGRIEVEMKSEDEKTTGMVYIPTSIDKTDTALIAAAVETIERIGPSEAKFQVIEIEDVRDKKREYIKERAKKLMEKFTKEVDLKEIEKEVVERARISKLQSYGKENLPCGDLSSEEIIVVEGRADVINLLRYGISNVIAMNGTVMPESIKKLGKEKTLILFIDGDRGGLLNAKEAIKNANIAFVARAPDGKEVEELSEKEILNSLRNKLSTTEFKKIYLEEKYGKEEREKKMSIKKLIEIALKIRDSALIYKEGRSIKTARISKNEIERILRSLKRKVIALITQKADSKIIEMAERYGVRYLLARNFSKESRKTKCISF